MDNTVISINGKPIGELQQIQYETDNVEEGIYNFEYGKEMSMTLGNISMSKEFKKWIEDGKKKQINKKRLELMSYNKWKISKY